MAKHLGWCLKHTLLCVNRMVAFEPTLSRGRTFDVSTPLLESGNFDYEEPKDLNVYLDEAKCTKNGTIDSLMKVLAVTRANATQALTNYPAFKYVPKHAITKNFEILREAGVCKSTIKDHKFLLTYASDELRKKIAIVQKIDVEINQAAHLFHLSVADLAAFESKCRMEATLFPTSNRIQYLAEKLKCDPARICHLLSHYPHMIKVSAPKLMTITEILLEGGIAPEFILKDPYGYISGINMIKEKLERAHRLNISPLKPWVLRCSDKVWASSEERNNDRHLYFRDTNGSLEDCLCDIFKCERAMAEHLLQRNPGFRKMKVERILAKAKLMHSEGYTINEIIMAPRVLLRCYHTLTKLRDARIKLKAKKPTLYHYCMSMEKFIEALEVP